MKYYLNQSKLLVICITLLMCLSVKAQSIISEITFLRVYNSVGKKIAKGEPVSVSDSTITLLRAGKYITIDYKDIGYVKTKRSAGHNVLMSSATGASIGVILGVSTADPDAILGYSASDGAMAFGSLGAIGGAAIGGITSAFKEPLIFIINGDFEKWKLLKTVIESDGTVNKGFGNLAKNELIDPK